MMKPITFHRCLLGTLPFAAWLCQTSMLHSAEQAQQPNAVSLSERKESEKATRSLKSKWADLAKKGAVRPEVPKTPTALQAPKISSFESLESLEQGLTPPRRLSLVLKAKDELQNPEDLRPDGKGVLTVNLEAGYAYNHIGSDLVHLRSFNGKLVGPTLRVKPGDKIRLTLRNTMDGERWRPNMMNSLNSFNTTNIHYHGLHVSPNGISDNVLILVGPHETQEYELDIPKDHTTGTYWYHPHRHGSTAGNVASGMSGALIIEGGLDDIPEIKAAKERVMVLNQIPYVMQDITKPKPETGTAKQEGVIEEKYADTIFAPGYWAKSGRYTTINGIQLPVLRMRPGQVERWRLVDSGQRETILLKLIPSPTTPATVALPPIKFQEIAVDGLALGKMVEKTSIELWPGYRSDVLVKAPLMTGEYILIDDTIPASSTISGSDKPLNYVARIIIEGQPDDMKLPTSDQMKGLRLPSIKDSEITGQQEATYGILLAGGGVVFTIDKESFQMETARTLKLNDVDEWTIYSKNDVGPVTHPFHIHVNPFEVTSIMAPVKDASGNVTLKEQLTDGPEWRDTVKIPGDGYVKMRTKYTDFIGTFVQHCHILDHEDQGMMELIDIVDPNGGTASAKAQQPVNVGAAAPDFELPDADGNKHSLAVTKGQPTVLFFFKGHGCLHCVEQVATFVSKYPAFVEKGIRVIGISTDEAGTLKEALKTFPCPFPLLADPKGLAFAKYGCENVTGLQHGTFVLDTDRRITWGTVGASPYMGVNTLLERVPSHNAARATNDLTAKPAASASASADSAGVNRNARQAGGAE